MSNPLLQPFTTPFKTAPFDKIKNEHFSPAVTEGIANAKKDIEAITNNQEIATFENVIEALEYAGDQLGKVTEIAFNLNSAETSDELQAIIKEISPLLTDHSNDILLNEELFKKVKEVYDNRESANLNAEQLRLLDKTYKGFVRNGALLSEKKKEQLRAIDKKKADLSLTFGEHVLKETNGYELLISDESKLTGLPDAVKEAAAMEAKAKKKEGWLFTLQYPSYIPFMMYAENRELRKELFMAFGSKAFKGDENDNQTIVKELANLRLERANLLGYDTHADFVLEQRMAEKPAKVVSFLDDILEKAKPFGEKEIKELTAYAKQHGLEGDIERWDFSFYSEKLKKEKFSIDDELLKPYFKLENAIDGVFQTASKLFGLAFKERKDIPVYHPDVMTYEVTDSSTDKLVGVFYADFFPREGKRGGAWMTSYQGQYKRGIEEVRPHVSIVCNFTKPTESKPSLLTFNEVTTLFHEFGHALHGLLADTTYESLSGTNVYWDFVELPSQVLENWCYEKECLDLFAKHYETGEKIPEELIQRIKESATFMEGYGTCRQVSLGKLDMAWHTTTEPITNEVADFEKQAMSGANLFDPVVGTSTSCSFSHIFQGGYSSGYYSYKWAEVLDADAFDLFKQKGIFNAGVATKFKEHVLSKGGTEQPMELYKKFRGQEPTPDALLKRAGLIKKG
ncbi:MAG: M3 family metallopeptidase [Cyclobacteriaceae bacterium]